MAALGDTSVYGGLTVQEIVNFNGGVNLNGGNLDVGGGDIVDDGTTIWDSSAGHIPSSQLEGTGPNHTISTNSPSGGSDGDVWFVV